jgi:hypothetical protein
MEKRVIKWDLMTDDYFILLCARDANDEKWPVTRWIMRKHPPETIMMMPWRDNPMSVHYIFAIDKGAGMTSVHKNIIDEHFVKIPHSKHPYVYVRKTYQEGIQRLLLNGNTMDEVDKIIHDNGQLLQHGNHNIKRTATHGTDPKRIPRWRGWSARTS